MACHCSNHHPFQSHPPCCCCRCRSSSSSSPPPCCCCCCCTANPAVQEATPTAASDPLLQAIAAHHLLQSTAAAASQHAHHLRNPQYPQPPFAHHHYQHQQQQQLKHKQQPPAEAQSLIQSLLRRIAALETALPQLSSPPPPPPPPATITRAPPPRNPQPSPCRTPSTRRVSIRDLAARTIQTHFRRYLVRRSRTLRHLKRLASVRSHVAAIKSSLSDEARLSPKDLSQKATDLLLQLDSIQSADPMIREGKRSISRELVRLLEFADEVSAKRRELYMESMETPHGDINRTKKPIPEAEELSGISTVSDGDEEELDTKSLKARASASNTAKRVGFTVNRNGPRVEAPFTDEGMAGSGAGLARVSENGAEEPSWEGGRGGGGSHRSSEEEESPRSGQKAGIRPVMNGSPKGQKGSHLLGLSAPVPLQMEPRRGDPRKKNVGTV